MIDSLYEKRMCCFLRVYVFLNSGKILTAWTIVGVNKVQMSVALQGM